MRSKKKITGLAGRVERVKTEKQARAELFDKQAAEIDELRQEITVLSSTTLHGGSIRPH
jgi:hypothetical protein